MIPFDAEFAQRSAAGLRRRRAGGRARRHAGLGRARTSASATRRAATPSCCAPTTRFETRVAPLVEVEGETVSSSHIRGLIAGPARSSTRVPRRARSSCAARWWTATGRGRELGFPTANLVPDERLICPGPRRLRLPRQRAPAAVNVGVRPTFETGRGVLIEAYLIDFEGDLYGTELRLEFLARLRGEKRFAERRGAGRADGPRRRAGAGRLPGVCYGSAPMTVTAERKRELVAKFGKGEADTGAAEVQVALLTERINELTEHLREHKNGPPLAPRAADAGRPAPAAAQLPAALRPRALPRAGQGARAPRKCHGARGRHARARLHADDRTGREAHARRPRGPDERAGLLPLRLQPGLHRPAQPLRGGPGRASRPRAPSSTASRATRPGRRRRSRSSSASRSSSSRTSSPRARPAAPSASTTPAASRSARS